MIFSGLLTHKRNVRFHATYCGACGFVLLCFLFVTMPHEWSPHLVCLFIEIDIKLRVSVVTPKTEKLSVSRQVIG